MDHIVYDIESAIAKEFGDKPMEIRPEDYGKKAILKETVCYIVGAVIFHEGRVLMVKEAKASCRGKWYLPAGKLKNNESLEEGAIREVLEESGLHFEPASLVYIDSQGSSWFRFTFVGFVTGGKLKAFDEHDKESLEAGWFTRQEICGLALRCKDILPLIDVGIKWYEIKQANPLYKTLPITKAHKNVILRLVIVRTIKSNDTDRMEILLCDKKENYSRPSLPCVAGLSNFCSVSTLLRRSLLEIDLQIQYKVHGYLNVEHAGTNRFLSGSADGLCLTVLVEILSPELSDIMYDGYTWFFPEDKDASKKIQQLIEVDGCVNLDGDC